MKDTILDVLASLLMVPGELQGEAAGALRNLTLDGIDSIFHCSLYSKKLIFRCSLYSKKLIFVVLFTLKN
jgi:hypothetical protein